MLHRSPTASLFPDCICLAVRAAPMELACLTVPHADAVPRPMSSSRLRRLCGVTVLFCLYLLFCPWMGGVALLAPIGAPCLLPGPPGALPAPALLGHRCPLARLCPVDLMIRVARLLCRRASWMCLQPWSTALDSGEHGGTRKMSLLGACHDHIRRAGRCRCSAPSLPLHTVTARRHHQLSPLCTS
jgi:hypothetical protein